MLYRTLELTLAPTLRAVYRPLVTGAEHVPRTGPVVLAANHVSFASQHEGAQPFTSRHTIHNPENYEETLTTYAFNLEAGKAMHG